MKKEKIPRVLGDPSKSLAVLAPYLIDELVSLPSEMTPETIYASSNVYALWACKVCSHEWRATLNNRLSGRGCPVCSNRVIIAGVNDFASSKYGQLLSQWDYNKNIVKPTELSPRSGKKVWWIGECGHGWYTSIHNRTTNDKIKGCPACSVPARMLVPGFNDFASVYPELVKFWHKDNVSKPESTLAGSRKVVTWQCDVGHTWDCQVYSIGISKTWCLQCNDILNPKIELAILDIIQEKYPDAVLHHKLPFKWKSGHKFEVDIWIESVNTAIEWDGGRWHTTRVDKDTEKTDIMLSNGLKVVRLRDGSLSFLDIKNHSGSLLQLPANWTLNETKLRELLNAVFDFIME